MIWPFQSERSLKKFVRMEFDTWSHTAKNSSYQPKRNKQSPMKLHTPTSCSFCRRIWCLVFTLPWSKQMVDIFDPISSAIVFADYVCFKETCNMFKMSKNWLFCTPSRSLGKWNLSSNSIRKKNLPTKTRCKQTKSKNNSSADFIATLGALYSSSSLQHFLRPMIFSVERLPGIRDLYRFPTMGTWWFTDLVFHQVLEQKHDTESVNEFAKGHVGDVKLGALLHLFSIVLSFLGAWKAMLCTPKIWSKLSS